MHTPKFAGILALFSMTLMASCASSPPSVVATAAHIPDQELSRRVEAALNTEPDTRGFALDADAFRGIVMLTGYVESPEIRAKAAKIAAAVAGVTEVRNSIEIRIDSRRKDTLRAGS